MIELAEATECDIPRIFEIECGAISPAWSPEALKSEICRGDSVFLLTLKCKEVVGFCILRRIADEGELLRIAVDKSHRRCGIADMLMNAALGWAEENALLSVYLEVREGNNAAIALYKKHGFVKAGLRKGYYDKPVENAVILVKNLAHYGQTEQIKTRPSFISLPIPSP